MISRAHGSPSRSLRSNQTFDVVLTSPLVRAVQTAFSYDNADLDLRTYRLKSNEDEDGLNGNDDPWVVVEPAPQPLDHGSDAVVLAPSNPFVSIGPLLAVPGMLDALRAAAAPVVGVSPIVGGAALRGPARQMLRSLAADSGTAGVARLYARRYPDLVDAFVIDVSDRAEEEAVRADGLQPVVLPTVMATDEDRRQLAEIVDRSSDGILTLDRAGTIESWNPAMEEMTGVAEVVPHEAPPFG